MSLNEIALVVGGVAIGIGSGSILSYVYVNRAKNTSVQIKDPEKTNDKVGQEIKEDDNRAPSLAPPRGARMVPSTLLEKSKRELRTLLLEKELVSAALTRLYEAEAAKEITKDEREILGAKYRDELKSLDEKILKIDAFIEVGDLETLRDQLVRLVNQKMEAIDRRIEHTKKVAEPLIAQLITPPPAPTPQPQVEAKPRVPDISDMLAPEQPKLEVVAANSPPQTTDQPTVESNPIAPEVQLQLDPRLRKRSIEPDSQAEQLQKELLDALDRLEKLDVET